MTRIAIFGAALLSFSAMTGCVGNCFMWPDKGCYSLGNNDPSNASREMDWTGFSGAMEWTDIYDGRISKLLAQHHYQEALRSFNNLARVYNNLDYYDARAEPLYKRAVTTLEGAKGLEHPYVAQSLENYAVLLRETGLFTGGLRDAEAAEMEARAKAIRAKSE